MESINLQDLLQCLLATCLFEFEKLTQQPMHFPIVFRRNKAIFYPVRELGGWVVKAPF